jgi:uncharacterized protein YdhG (YjbR/CyaY superfamily)
VPQKRSAKTAFQSVDEYIATHPPKAQAALQQVRSAIRKAVPGAEETISYQIPTYKRHGRYAVYFAGWKKHYSLYPASSRLLAAFADDLAPYEIEKATIRFPLRGPVPVRLIARLAKFMAKEADERAAAKNTASKTKRR